MAKLRVATIPTKADWDSLPSKQDKKDLLIEMRKEFPDKDIREAWGMKPGNWYNTLARYGIKGKRAEEKEAAESARTGSGKGKGTPPPPDPDIILGAGGGGGFSGDDRRPSEGGRRILDAEYRVVDEEPQRPRQALVPMGFSEAEQVDLPFPIIKGTAAQLRKQMEAVCMFLEAQEGEEARFQIKVQVYRS